MIYVLFGKSASGKDTILNELVKNYSYKPIVSTTSRPMRDGEVDGVNYNFTTRENFEKMIKNNELIEHRSYNTLVNGISDTWYYGVKKQDFSDGNYVTVLDTDGLESFINAYGREEIFGIYVFSSDATRKARAMSRGSFDETEWDRRLADDDVKFTQNPKLLYMIDMLIMNDDSFYTDLDTATVNKFVMLHTIKHPLPEMVKSLNYYLKKASDLPRPLLWPGN